MWEMQILVNDKWMTVKHAIQRGVNACPWMYEYKQDAERMLEKLYPDTPPECRRVKRV